MFKIGGIDVDRIVEKVGSPVYVYDEDKLNDQLSEYKTSFVSDRFKTDVLFASKAFTCKEMLKLVKAHDLGLDVVSGGELYVANTVDFNGDKIFFHGNNKTDEEIKMALNCKVKTIVIDNMYEVDKIIKFSEELNQDVHVLIRINPHIEAHTHKYIMTASKDSKFGISKDMVGLISEIIEKINSSNHVIFDGYHSHIGSQILKEEGFIAAVDEMVKFASEMTYPVKVMNFGGGFGVHYTKSDHPLAIKTICKIMINSIETSLNKYGLDIDEAIIEPGRSIVAEAGYTLYKVGFIKQTENKQFAFIDGGMADNIRPALYNALYECDCANKIDEEKSEYYDIAGKCCESGDIIIEKAFLPHLTSGDIIVVYSTGAYGYSMASNYNRLNKPPVVFASNNKARLVIKGETIEEQMKNETNEEVI